MLVYCVCDVGLIGVGLMVLIVYLWPPLKEGYTLEELTLEKEGTAEYSKSSGRVSTFICCMY